MPCARGRQPVRPADRASRSSWQGERGADEVHQEPADFVAAHDEYEDAGEADSGEGRDGVGGC
jgi:hypothetical protein